MKTKILITGVAGFIGFNVARKLLNLNYKIIGIDNLNNYYNPQIKKDRLKNLPHKNFIFYKSDIRSKKLLEKIFKKHKPEFVLNLAAQAGVRYSLEKPEKYISNNINGFFNILDCSKKFNTDMISLFDSS